MSYISNVLYLKCPILEMSYILHHEVAKIKGFEYLSLWQRLNSFSLQDITFSL